MLNIIIIIIIITTSFMWNASARVALTSASRLSLLPASNMSSTYTHMMNGSPCCAV